MFKKLKFSNQYALRYSAPSSSNADIMSQSLNRIEQTPTWQNVSGKAKKNETRLRIFSFPFNYYGSKNSKFEQRSKKCSSFADQTQTFDVVTLSFAINRKRKQLQCWRQGHKNRKAYFFFDEFDFFNGGFSLWSLLLVEHSFWLSLLKIFLSLSFIEQIWCL